MKNIILFLFIVFIFSCGTYTPKKIASHIVAVTLQGDTILVPIEKIRPNMYQSYYPVYSNYNYYRPYYGSDQYRFKYYDNRGTKNNNIPIKPKIVNTVPDINTRPNSDVLMKNKK
tara:strand:+ start:642 stop:986 length:345 start_codon:yes stop_codon:yes gene_type:complete